MERRHNLNKLLRIDEVVILNENILYSLCACCCHVILYTPLIKQDKKIKYRAKRIRVDNLSPFNHNDNRQCTVACMHDRKFNGNWTVISFSSVYLREMK